MRITEVLKTAWVHQHAGCFSEETPELKRELPELFPQCNKTEVEENRTQPSALRVGVPAPTPSSLL